MLIVASKSGQLANRLFQFAHFIAFSVDHGFAISNPSFDEYAQFFPAWRDDLYCRFPLRSSGISPSPVKRRAVAAAAKVASKIASTELVPPTIAACVRTTPDAPEYELAKPEHLETMKSTRFTFFDGWRFRDEQALLRHSALVRELFEPCEPHCGNVLRLTEPLLDMGDTLVGVHIRLGDYATWNDGQYFYSLGQYANLMERVRAAVAPRRVTFLVCSSHEIMRAKLTQHRTVFGTGHPVEDLYALSRCEYVIGPPSTFSLWASLYGGCLLYHVYDVAASITLSSFRSYDNITA